MIIEHTVLIGYGITGRAAARALPHNAEADLVVVDTDVERALLALREGARPVLGDGEKLAVLRAAGVPDATCVLVTVPDDLTAIRITTTARSLTRTAKIITMIRDPGWQRLAAHLGADQAIACAEIVGRILGKTLREPNLPERVERTLRHPPELVVGERTVRAREVGHAATECDPLVLAVIRNGTRLWRDHPHATRLRPDDRLLVLRAGPTPNSG